MRNFLLVLLIFRFYVEVKFSVTHILNFLGFLFVLALGMARSHVAQVGLQLSM